MSNKTAYREYHEWRNQPLPKWWLDKYAFTDMEPQCHICNWVAHHTDNKGHVRSAKSKKNYVVLAGDSNIRKLFDTFKNKYQNCKCVRKAGKCTLTEYMGLKPFSSQNQTDQFKYVYPFCTDCNHKGKDSTTLECDDTFLEYLWNIYARDTLFPASTTETTQKSIGKYLSYIKPSAVVLITGTHDIGLKNLTDKQYIGNVKEMLGNIVPHSPVVIWLDTPACLGEKKYPQRNDRIYIWNMGVTSIIDKYFPNVSIIHETYALSLDKNLHTDNVHMKQSFYEIIGNKIESIIKSKQNISKNFSINM